VSFPPDNQPEHGDAPDGTVRVENVRCHPQRAAAKRARTRVLEWTTRLRSPPGGC